MKRLDAFTDLLAGAAGSERVVQLPITELHDSPVQVRGALCPGGAFNPGQNPADAELLASIKQRLDEGKRGIIQPLLVRQRDAGGYWIIEGHRRRSAALMAGMKQVPCIVVSADETDAAVQTAMANVQRQDLSPLEEGLQYVAVMRLTGWSARHLACQIGKPARTVQQRVQLTMLPVPVQQLLAQGQLSVEQALACRDEAWGGIVAEVAAARRLQPDQIAASIALMTEQGLDLETAVRQVTQTDSAKTGNGRKPLERVRPSVNYRSLVADLNLGLSPREQEQLADFCSMQKLEPTAVRWAGLLVVNNRGLMTVSAAVAYASQLAESRAGRALRGMSLALEQLERRAGKCHLTANLVTGAHAAIRDLQARLERVAEMLEETPRRTCAGAAEPD